ncbi:hypothetical protein J1N35_025508 [Gossypium stocksii]|uniref:Uncharacterized protein n=1 Tax=Gossypium stocksii TaxID=47602 RepID=A0A9D3V6P2_9ROSI|nr:hypothetical protein J1N35_025508 [Gossypium stocksii]
MISGIADGPTIGWIGLVKPYLAWTELVEIELAQGADGYDGSVSTNASEGGTSSSPLVPPTRRVIPEASVEQLVQAMIGAFQWITNGNPVPSSHGLPLERLRALDGKEFRGVKGVSPVTV